MAWPAAGSSRLSWLGERISPTSTSLCLSRSRWLAASWISLSHSLWTGRDGPFPPASLQSSHSPPWTRDPTTQQKSLSGIAVLSHIHWIIIVPCHIRPSLPKHTSLVNTVVYTYTHLFTRRHTHPQPHTMSVNTNEVVDDARGMPHPLSSLSLEHSSIVHANHLLSHQSSARTLLSSPSSSHPRSLLLRTPSPPSSRAAKRPLRSSSSAMTVFSSSAVLAPCTTPRPLSSTARASSSSPRNSRATCASSCAPT